MRPRLLSNKKGVSPTVSSVLMITITVAAMILVISFGLDFIDNRNAQMGERLAVEKVLFTDPDIIQVYVRNIGSRELIVIQAKVNEQLHDLTDGEVAIPTDGMFVTIQLPLTQGPYTISFITSRYTELGRIEVEY